MHYINCLFITIEFLEQMLQGVPVNSQLWGQINQRFRLYRQLTHRDYLVPILGMNNLIATDSWYEIFKTPAIKDFQMMINSVHIFLIKMAECRESMFKLGNLMHV